jgi:hypothetical protein
VFVQLVRHDTLAVCRDGWAARTGTYVRKYLVLAWASRYTANMGALLKTHRHRVHRWTGRALLLVSIFRLLEAANLPVEGSHCAQHGASAIHLMGVGAVQQMPQGAGMPSWQGPSHSDCPHCPASECARLVPCATTTIVAVATRPDRMVRGAIHRSSVLPVRLPFRSATHPPPTPPPQLIA